MASLISRRLSHRLFAASRSSSLYSPSRPHNTVAKPSSQASTTTTPTTTQKPRILQPGFFLRSSPFATFSGQSESPDDNDSSKELSSIARDLLEDERVPISMWRAHSNFKKQEFVLFLRRQLGDEATEKPSGFIGIPESSMGMAGLSTMQLILGYLVLPINPSISTLTYAAYAVNFWMAIELQRFRQKSDRLNVETEGDLPRIIAAARSTAQKMLLGFILAELICLGVLIRADQIIPDKDYAVCTTSGIPFLVFMLGMILHLRSEISELLLSKKSQIPKNWRMVVNYVLQINIALKGLVGIAMFLPISHLILAFCSK